MFIALNKHLRAQRRRLMVTLALTALAFGVALAHSALGGGHMTTDDMGGQGQAVIAMCVAIGETATLIFVGLALSAFARRVRRIVFLLPVLEIALPRRAPVDLRARSSPVRLQVMRH